MPEASPLDLERDQDQDLRDTVDQLYNRFQQTAAATHKRIADAIRSNPHVFVVFEE
ncbi:hypothetical protein [Brevibacillus borstelensis]|uniref:hypothetical protein n=1 Tax=Brevibacillus borstelensis TaxID=45462 RepID=UPI0030C38C49